METLYCTLQVHADGAWQDAAVLELTGQVDLGIAAPTYLIYLADYALRFWERRDAAALSVTTPVDLTHHQYPHWPAFLTDLLPQGYGRTELLKQLEKPEHAGPGADWALLCAGAGNPIGNMRIKEAHAWVAERAGDARRGFTVDEVVSRAGDFNEYLAQHGLFLAGSSGVQGEWPKILLTRARDGLFYLDHTLPDHEAEQHFIVKFGRGSDQALAAILRLEAPYMQLARSLGLNVHADLDLRERALFIPRFDREVDRGQVLRHGQESIASLCGVSGFGAVPTHNDVCRRLGEVATDPERDIIEYLKRDIANIVLGNKDNHARNTAIARKADGTVSLTPLYDFAPMWMHPDGIARRIRWERDDGGSPAWASALAQACQAAQLDQAPVRAALKTMARPLSTLFDEARRLGVDDAVLAPFRATLDRVRMQIEEL